MELLEAASKGNMVQLEKLLSAAHYAGVDVRDNRGETPLMRGAEKGSIDVVRFLVEQGASVDTSDNDGWSPLMWAARYGRLEVARFLLECGAAVEAGKIDDWTPLMCAAGEGHIAVVQLLVECGAVVHGRNGDNYTPLIQAARGGYLDVVQYLVSRATAVDVYDSSGETALMRAARGGHLNVVRFLITRGANVKARSNIGQTPLICGVCGGHMDMVRFLGECRVSVDVYENSGETALIHAAGDGHLDMVRFLVEHGAAIDASDIYGRTPLVRAADGGHLEVVRYLVICGAAVDDSTSDGWTPLMRATRYGYLNVVRCLVEHGAAVDASDSDGWTPLMRASSGGYLTLARYLVEHGAAVGTSSNDEWTPLMRAADGGHLDVVRFLVECGAAVHVSNSNGQTPLICVACGGHLDVARFLVECGAAVDVSDNDGRTPLMVAAKFGHLHVVRYLVEHGANPNLTSMAGHTAISSAAKSDRQDVVKFLLPFVRYQGQRTQTEHLDGQKWRASSIPPNWLVPPFEIEVEPFNDAGNIGGGFRGKWLEADVVVKLFVDDATSASFVDEVRLWFQLRHPNVLKLYGVCNSHHQLFVCEHASNGSLSEYLKACETDYHTPWKFLYEAALGLEYLHERKIVHGTLCGSNILIGSDGLAKLTGFTSRASSYERKLHASTDWVRWAAPECFMSEQISLESDVYSLGMCIIEAVTGMAPFGEFNEIVVRIKIKPFSNHLKMIVQQMKLSRPEMELVLEMCQNDPDRRPQMLNVVKKLQHFAEIEATKLMQNTAQPKPEPLVNFDTFDELRDGNISSLRLSVKTLVGVTENDIYCRICNDLELIFNTLRTDKHPRSILERFEDLLIKCQLALEGIAQQSRVCSLSSNLPRDHAVERLYRHASQLLQLVCPTAYDAEKREIEWKRLCGEQVEKFVSKAPEVCRLQSSIESEENSLAITIMLRTELRNSDRIYTDNQLAVLQNAHDEIVTKSLDDVSIATTPEWFIPWCELEMNEMMKLGEGGFGSVIKAQWLDSEVVVKKLKVSIKDATNTDKMCELRQVFEREVDIWFRLNHPHVVRLFGACHVGLPFFVCELALNGTLVEYLRRRPDELWSKLREATLGVQYLHARGIVHGDLKGNNILVGSDGKAKVTDFGLSGVFGDGSTEGMISGAWHWVAPECLLGEKPTFVSDVYSLGMCIIEALRVTSGVKYYLPWGELPNVLVKYHATRCGLPGKPGNCSDNAWILIERMCKSSPSDRLHIMTVVDELEKLVGGHGDLSDEQQQIVSDSDKLRLISCSVSDVLAEMKNWIGKYGAKEDWEGGVLVKIYQLLWDRLEQVAIQLFPDGDDTVVSSTSISDFGAVVECSRQRTQTALGITDVIPLIKFTELVLRGYALHRRLDKYMAAHGVPKWLSPLHDWISACNMFMRTSANLTPDFIEIDSSMDKMTGSVQAWSRQR